MGIELTGSSPKLDDIADKAAYLAARAQVVTGIPAQEAFMHGAKAGNYAGRYLLIALVNCGLLDIETIDTGSLQAEMQRIEAESGITVELARVHTEEGRMMNARD